MQSNYMSQSAKDRTTLTVSRDTHQEFNRAKPYDSMSADEFVGVLLNEWEGDA